LSVVRLEPVSSRERLDMGGGTVAAARFMIVQGVFVRDVPVPEWPGAGGATVRSDPRTQAGWTTWRLVGPNQRELGRSARVFPNVAACIADATTVTASLDTAVMALSARMTQWTWELTVGGELVAVASRLYQRQRECEYNSRVFLVTAPSAQPPSMYVVPQPRLDVELGATTE
jgi:hypothetical protein